MTMRRATTHHPVGQWSEDGETGSVTLAFADRHRRRVLMTDDAGAEFLLDLPAAVLLRHGDGLELAGGGVLRVVAAREPVADIHCLDPVHLARVAWHLGNRHLAVQVRDAGSLRIAQDHVIEAMAKGLGGIIKRLSAPFEPEGGAYGGGGHGHGHGHDHGSGHAHDHAHDHDHGHAAHAH